MRRTIAPIAVVCLLLACDSKKPDEASKTADAKTESKTESAPDAKGDAKPPGPGPDAKAPAEAEPEKPKKYGGEFCATIIPCFEKMKFAGNFSADVSVDIEPDGSVSAVSFTGEAPKPVQTCITDTIKGITLADYSGKPGRTRCTKSGQLVGGTRMVMSDMTYEEREAGAPAAEAEADDAKADDAKADDAKKAD